MVERRITASLPAGRERLRRAFYRSIRRHSGLPYPGAFETGVENILMRKITFIGGGGVRTPLVIHGLAQAQSLLNIGELTLFDVDSARTETIARLGREIVRKQNGGFEIRTATGLEAACQGADFVLNSVRVGGIAGRARDNQNTIDTGACRRER